jgi:hypothetical protein
VWSVSPRALQVLTEDQMAVMERASAIPSATRPVFPVAGHRHQLTPDLPGGLTLARRGHSRLRRSVKHEALVSIDFSTCFLSDNERSYTRQVDHGIKKMMGTMRKKVAKSNDDALAAFVAKKVEIDLMLTRLGALSDDHFGVARRGHLERCRLLGAPRRPSKANHRHGRR